MSAAGSGLGGAGTASGADGASGAEGAAGAALDSLVICCRATATHFCSEGRFSFST
jgi:hypothetical protein